MNERRADATIGWGLLALCAFAAWRTLRIPSVATGTSAGPNFVPWLMICAIVILSVAMIVRQILNRPAPSLSDSEDVQAQRSRIKGILWRLAAFTLLLVIYAVLFMPLGYLPTTIIVFIAGMFLLGEKRLVPLVVLPIVITTVIYFGFTRLLAVWLP